MAKHFIVTTSKMAGTINDAFIDVTLKASTDIDNGTIVNADFGKGTVTYATDETKEMFLVCTPEHARYNGETLEEFYNKQGDKVRVMKLMVGDEFGTNAIEGGVSGVEVGTKLQVTANGKFTSGAGKFVVVEKKMVGFTLVADLRYMG